MFKLALWSALVFFVHGSEMQVATALVINVLQLCVHVYLLPMGGVDAALLNGMQTCTLVLTTYINFGALTMNYLELSMTLARFLDPTNVDKYDGKKKVHWSGFSSTTTDESIARTFAGVGGLVLKIDVQNGKNVQPYSWFGKDEAELVLTPNMEFMVCRAGKAAKKPYVVNGITYIDLLQLPSETLYS